MNILSEDVPGACFWTRSGKTRGLAVGESRISGEECRGVGGRVPEDVMKTQRCHFGIVK